jgi:molybdate-binding protein
MDPRAIDGYVTEEYTHAAVAAYVASGMADVGLGVEPAARQFNLGFVPIATERYFLICSRQTLQYPWVEEVLRLMRGPEFQELVASLPGYLADRSGEIMELTDAFPWLATTRMRARGRGKLRAAG